jgi:arginine decarboxylase
MRDGQPGSDEALPDPEATPFFAALVDWARGDATQWGSPGHGRGDLFARSAAGRAFLDFYGGNMLRGDASTAVESLGQLLDHTGSIGAAERRAADTFRGDHLFFVVGGTSAANKIVWNACVGAGDVVLVDRNCHKSVLHAIMLTGAIPVYLRPARNAAGLIGPIRRGEFTRDSIRRRLAAHPLVRDQDRPVRLIALTQATYDGIVYDADAVKELLDGVVDILHFDEAWLPQAAFHEFYDGWHAVDNTRPRTRRSVVYATQSTHKLLAGLSMASQVVVQDAESASFDRGLFNEAFMMHTSTSPQYALVASCEMAAAMMRGEAGRELVAAALAQALAFRRALAGSFTGRDTRFGVWGPDPAGLASPPDPVQWELAAGADWHGFEAVDDGFTMLDPVKVTVTTPGLGADGAYADRGIPAVVVKKYLAERGVVVEKSGLYSLLFIVTIGTPRGAWRRVIAALEEFLSDYDANTSLGDVLPAFVHANPGYDGRGLRDVCDGLHAAYRDSGIVRVTADAYTDPAEPAMLPSDAFRQLAAGNVEHVPVAEVAGRITGVLLTPYPPGIPLVVPGERISETVVRFLQHEGAVAREWPGFAGLTHGLAEGDSPGQWAVPCVAATATRWSRPT